MVSRGTKKPYVQAIGASATGVTQSCYIVRFKKYVIMLDCGLYQESDIATNYKKNQELLKKIKPRDIDWIILHECHADHTCLVPVLYARGCQAHLIVPYGSKQFLKLLWEDSMKIFTQDCQKLNNKGMKASPFYTQDDIDKTLNRVIEVGWTTIPTSPVSHYLTEDIRLQYYPSNHIINACQIYLTFQDGYTTHRLSFTGDIGGTTPQPYVDERMMLPYANLMLAESTYCQPKRMNKAYDRVKDKEKIEAVIRDSHRVLIPCFSLGRTNVKHTPSPVFLLAVYQAVVNGDYLFLEVAVLPPQSYDFSNSTSCAEQNSKEREPMPVRLAALDILYKSRLLRFCQSMALGLFPVMASLYFCHSPIRRVDTNQPIPHGYRKYGVDDCVDNLHAVGLKPNVFN